MVSQDLLVCCCGKGNFTVLSTTVVSFSLIDVMEIVFNCLRTFSFSPIYLGQHVAWALMVRVTWLLNLH
jgi:hypothetical protein